MTSKKVKDEIEAMADLNVVPDVSTFGPKRAQQFMSWVDEYESLREAEKVAKEARGFSENGQRHVGIGDSIKDMLADLKAVMLPDGRKVQVVERQGNEYVDVKLLLEAGVSATTIAQCKRRGAPSWHILVSGKTK